MASKILVLGSKGLFGSHLCKLYPEVIGIPREECDITNRYQVYQTFLKYKPDVVINAAGAIPQKVTDVETLYRVNGYGPKLLETACAGFKARLIHISTNCVFSGRRPHQTEANYPDPVDAYGLSKFFGEIVMRPHVTIRTSLIGLPDPKGKNLLGWAANQSTIRGYKNAIWNGVTTVELARVIMKQIVPSEIRGLIHVHATDEISKHDLLQFVAELYEWDVNIYPVDEPNSHNTLQSIYDPLVNKTVEEMLVEMKKAFA